MAIETLAIAIRQNPDILGVSCGDQIHKCGLFADDLLLFLTSPITSLPNLYRVISEFSKISGLQVNYAKSQALNVSLPHSTVFLLQQSFKFEWCPSSIKYLGISLTACTESLYTNNYPPLYRKLTADMNNWAKYELSWLGRINSIKMTLLPRILYLFRSLPIPIRKDQLQSLQSKILKFIWGKSGYRIPQNTLYNHRKRGGLGLPHLYKYFLAARLAQLSVVYSKFDKPDWVHIEKQAVPHLSLDYLLWCPQKRRPPILSPSLSQSYALWDRIRHLPALVSKAQPLANIFQNPNFPPGMGNKAFSWWLDKGLYRIGHYLTTKGPLTLEHCLTKLDLPDTEKPRFSQISQFLQTLWTEKPLPPKITDYEL